MYPSSGGPALFPVWPEPALLLNQDINKNYCPEGGPVKAASLRRLGPSPSCGPSRPCWGSGLCGSSRRGPQDSVSPAQHACVGLVSAPRSDDWIRARARHGLSKLFSLTTAETSQLDAVRLVSRDGTKAQKGQTHTPRTDSKPAAPWATLSTACDHSHHSHSSLVQTPGTQQRPTSPEAPPGTVSLCLLPEEAWAGLWSREYQEARGGTAAPRSSFLAEPRSCTRSGSGLGAEPVAPRLPLPSFSLRAPSTWLPCTPVLTAQSTPWPGLSPVPTQISSPVKSSFLSMEKQPDGALPC